MDLEEAIRKHTEWKLKFRMAIFRKEQLDAATIAKDDCCMLGQWLHGPAGASLGSLPEFNAACAVHKAFHIEAGKVAETINAAKYAEAEHAMANDSAYATVSHRVAATLTALMHATSG